jgi:hypothetical protein
MRGREVEVRPGHKYDSSAVLVVSNAKVKMEAQYFIHLLGLHDVLRESFSL